MVSLSDKMNDFKFILFLFTGGALLKIPPINQTVMEGENAFFHCVVKNPDTMTVTWFKDDQNLLDFHDLSSRSFTGPDGSLTIAPTQMSDLGEYDCKVKNLMGEEQTAGAYLNVQCKLFLISCLIILNRTVALWYGEG